MIAQRREVHAPLLIPLRRGYARGGVCPRSVHTHNPVMSGAIVRSFVAGEPREADSGHRTGSP
jgi:hypothetical protein